MVMCSVASSVCLCVCLSVCNAVTSESLNLEGLFLVLHVSLRNIQLKFVYQGHRVKVKVTGIKRNVS